MTVSSTSRHFEDVSIGDQVSPLDFELPVYRLVMEAGANRDFNSIHHNTEFAVSTGAEEMYANTGFLLGMWERAVREWMGPSGTIVSFRKFRMSRFNYVGQKTTVRGSVASVDPTDARVVLTVYCEDKDGITVGPGEVHVQLPTRG